MLNVAQRAGILALTGLLDVSENPVFLSALKSVFQIKKSRNSVSSNLHFCSVRLQPPSRLCIRTIEVSFDDG